MQFGMRFLLLASVSAVMNAVAAAVPAQAQLDLTPPGVRQSPGPQRAHRAPQRAPHSAPVPVERPGDIPGDETVQQQPDETAPADAAAGTTVQPQPTPPPSDTGGSAATVPAASAPATPSAPPPADPALAGGARPADAPQATGAATNRIDEAFAAAANARPGPPAVAETAPTLSATPMPEPRPAELPGTPPVTGSEAAAATPPSAPHIPPPFAEAPSRRVEGRPFPEQRHPAGREAHLATLRKYAEANKVPIDLADAVAMIESAYDPQAVGNSDEIGIMQVRASIARDAGFTGTTQDLFEPDTNIRIGVTYLAGAWERAGGNVCQALMKYRVGWEEARISPLSAEYCRRALLYLNAIGSPLARGLAAPPSLNAVPGSGVGRGLFDWEDHNTRLRQIEQRFGGENFGIIAR